MEKPTAVFAGARPSCYLAAFYFRNLLYAAKNFSVQTLPVLISVFITGGNLSFCNGEEHVNQTRMSANQVSCHDQRLLLPCFDFLQSFGARLLLLRLALQM